VERGRGATILLTNKTVISAAVIAALPELRFISVLATGTNVVQLTAARRAGVTVSNVPGYSSDSVAQHVFALLFELLLRVGAHDRAVHAGAWSNAPDFSLLVAPTTEVAGKTLGIVGVGAIGRRVALVGHALGMKIAAAQQSSMSQVDLGPVQICWRPLDQVFRIADVLTLHCPLTPATRRLANATRLFSMKPSAVLINTGRGELVDETALAEALAQDRIAGAGLDVLSTEPPPADHPLLHAPGCVLSPHIAWATREARRRLLRMTEDNVAAFLAGRPINVVT
jgi:glycerate dehydrogenase